MYINAAKVKKLCNDNGKQASKEFLGALDKRVYELIINACSVWNGGRKRISAEMLTGGKK